MKVRDGCNKGRSNFLLYKVSDSLLLLAEQHAPVAEALSILAGSVRNSANLLEILVAMKMGPPVEVNLVTN